MFMKRGLRDTLKEERKQSVLDAGSQGQIEESKQSVLDAGSQGQFEGRKQPKCL